MDVEIPRASPGHEGDREPGHPCWFPISDRQGKAHKPIIRCNCGRLIGLRLHRVHSDGRVTASFFHAREDQLQKDAAGFFFVHEGKKYYTEPGCGWHVFLKLLGYAGGDFPGES